MVGAFPKAGFVLVGHDLVVGGYSPEPFSVFVVYDVVLDVVPGVDGVG